jgi:hypothetical protein
MVQLGSTPPRIFHLHLPKAGGTTLQARLLELSGGHSIRAEPGHARAAFDGLAPCTSVSGHLTLFPGDWQAIASRCLTITVLRDPRERLISWYFQLRRGAEYEVDPWVATAKSLELRPFLRHILDVGYRDGTRLCADWLSAIAWDGCGRLTDEDVMRLSCEALDYIDLVGFVDRLDDVGDVLSQRFGRYLSPLPRLNTSTSEEWAGVDEEAWTLAEASVQADSPLPKML